VASGEWRVASGVRRVARGVGASGEWRVARGVGAAASAVGDGEWVGVDDASSGEVVELATSVGTVSVVGGGEVGATLLQADEANRRIASVRSELSFVMVSSCCVLCLMVSR